MGYCSRSLRRAALLGLLLSLLAQTVRAESLRILLENAGPELSRAARAAFSSSAQLRITQDPSLLALRELDAQSARARELARVQQVDIVVWWTGSELNTYDARSDRLLGTRRAPSLPISAVSAAALVLSIKAQLQAVPEQLAVAVPSAQQANDSQLEAAAPQRKAASLEREAASPEREAASPEREGASPQREAASPQREAASPQRKATYPQLKAAPPQPEAAAARTDAAREPTVPLTPMSPLAARTDSSGDPSLRPQPTAADSPPVRTYPLLRAAKQPGLVVALQAGLASTERELLPVFGLGAAGWFGTTPFGFALRAQSGPEAKLQSSLVHAQLLDAALAADVIVRAPTWLALRIWGGVGPSLHLTRLHGSLGVSVDAKRIVPGFGGVVHVEFDLTDRWFIGAWASAGWLLVTQRYFVDGTLIHESSRPRAAFGMMLGRGLDRK